MAMEAIKLSVKKRDAKTKAKKLRSESIVPGVLYGRGQKNVNVSAVFNEFVKVLRSAGESTLVDAEVEGDGTAKVLIKDTQVNPITGAVTHFDLFQVDLNKKLRVETLLNFVGESPAVKELGGSLVKNLTALKVECLPTDLVHAIDVDVTKLKAFGEMIHVRDLVLPKGIEAVEDAGAVVVLAEAPMTEEQFKAMEAPAAVDVTAIKTEGEVKKAEEEAKKAAEEAAKEAAK